MRILPWLLVAGLASVAGLSAQQPRTTISIWPGVAPGSENWTRKEAATGQGLEERIFNVVTPTLTVFLPEPAVNTGTAVIIAPGGAFRYVTIDKEGYAVARWLAAKGIAGLVLKYRVAETPAEQIGAQAGRGTGAAAAGGRSGAAAPSAGAAASGARGGAGASSMDENGKFGIADGIQAIKVARQHASEWRISPDRIVFAGFSAGAMVTTGTLLQPDAGARPDYAAPIYGGPFGVMPEIPKGLPPVFLAWAQDDALAGNAAGKFYEALKAAGYKPELHLYSAGGHGFGMIKKGTSSDHWIEDFYNWLEAQKLTKPAPTLVDSPMAPKAVRK
jgi:acetyl esterase/lipase